jgi:hypothetical protein
LASYVKGIDVLFMSKYSKNPILASDDEEYAMLIEDSQEFDKQIIAKAAHEKSGSAKEIVIRNHLLRRNLTLSTNPRLELMDLT